MPVIVIVLPLLALSALLLCLVVLALSRTPQSVQTADAARRLAIVLALADDLASRGVRAKLWAEAATAPRVRYARLEQIIRDRAARPPVTEAEALALVDAAQLVDPKHAQRLAELAREPG